MGDLEIKKKETHYSNLLNYILGSRKLEDLTTHLAQVDKRVVEPGSGVETEQVECQRVVGLCGEVEGADQEEGENVLQVVLVSPPHSLHIRIRQVHFPIRELRVLSICIHLLRE